MRAVWIVTVVLVATVVLSVVLDLLTRAYCLASRRDIADNRRRAEAGPTERVARPPARVLVMTERRRP